MIPVFHFPAHQFAQEFPAILHGRVLDLKILTLGLAHEGTEIAQPVFQPANISWAFAFGFQVERYNSIHFSIEIIIDSCIGIQLKRSFFAKI